MEPIRPRVRADLTITELDGEAVIYDERSGDLHHLNGPATLVLGLCDGEASVADMSVAIAEAFERPVSEVTAQIAHLIEGLLAAGIVEAGLEVR